MPISPTAEGFRAAFRRPSLTLGEITWRWMVGTTAAVLFLFGLFEYLGTLPVTNGELLFLRTRHPYFVAQAIEHIFRGSLSRAAMAAIVAAMMLGVLWIIAASVGRLATVRALVDYFRSGTASDVSTTSYAESQSRHPWPALVRLNFLRTAVALAAVFGFLGAAILAGFVSPDSDPQPWLAFLLFLPLAGIICLAWCSLNWLLSLAGMFAVRDGENASSAILAAVDFCRERARAIFAVSTWTGLAHFAIFVCAATAVSMPLGFAGMLPWRLIVLGMILVTLVYFALADWLYMARLAGYVCIAERPEALVALLPPAPIPRPLPVSPVAPAAPIQTAIDRDELILSDHGSQIPE
jgi:hypothetical protein